MSGPVGLRSFMLVQIPNWSEVCGLPTGFSLACQVLTAALQLFIVDMQKTQP